MKRTMTPRQNFVICMVEAQLLGSAELQTGGLDYPRIAAALRGLNVFFTVAFAVELAVNAFANWFRRFAHDGWSIFDLVVVTASLVALTQIRLPVSVIRLMRAFRVSPPRRPRRPATPPRRPGRVLRCGRDVRIPPSQNTAPIF